MSDSGAWRCFTHSDDRQRCPD